MRKFVEASCQQRLLTTHFFIALAQNRLIEQKRVFARVAVVGRASGPGLNLELARARGRSAKLAGARQDIRLEGQVLMMPLFDLLALVFLLGHERQISLPEVVGFFLVDCPWRLRFGLLCIVPVH